MATQVEPAVERERERSAGRGYFWAGIALFLLAIGLVAVQFAVIKWMVTPWQLPILATLGAAFLLLAVARRRTVVRVVLLVLVTVFAGYNWYFMASMSRLPNYEGPARAGEPIPAFQTALADGTPFTHEDLQDGRRSVMVFFRGRW